MRSSRPTRRVSTPNITAPEVGADTRADSAVLPSVLTGSSSLSNPIQKADRGADKNSRPAQSASLELKAAELPALPPPSAIPSHTFSNANPHPSLITLARILGRQAARDWLKGER